MKVAVASADGRAADAVARAPAAPVRLRAPKTSSARPDLVRRIAAKRGGGAGLPPSAVAAMPEAVGGAARRARLHADGDADRLARALNARAFAVGEDIFSRSGAIDPGRPDTLPLLVHELAHVEQQRGVGSGGVRLGVHGDRHEREARRIAHGGATRVVERDGVPHIRREEIPLPDWGNVWWPAHDDSEWTVDANAQLLVGGRPTTRVNFASGARQRMTIPLNTDADLRLSANVSALRDDKLGNPTNAWTIQYDWRVTVDDRGRLTIRSPTHLFTGGAGSLPWSLTISPIQQTGGGSVGLGFTLQSTEKSVSGNALSIGPSISGGDDVKIGISGGYSHTSGSQAGSTLTSGYGIVLDLATPRPAPRLTLEIGPITVTRDYPFYFATNSASLGRNPVTGADENVRLTPFLLGLDEQHNDGANISGTVSGYASPIGDVEANRRLARRRAQYLVDRIHDVLPRAHFSVRVFGEDIWRAQGVPDTDNSQRHRVVILEVSTTVPPP